MLTPDGSLFLVIGHAARKPWTAMRVAEIAGKRFHLQNQIIWVKSITVHGGEDRGDHPATFPPQVAERCIKLAGAKPGMKVLDPFSGVTGMEAAARLGVDGVGIDIDPTYCNTAKERLNNPNAGERINMTFRQISESQSCHTS